MTARVKELVQLYRHSRTGRVMGHFCREAEYIREFVVLRTPGDWCEAINVPRFEMVNDWVKL